MAKIIRPLIAIALSLAAGLILSFGIFISRANKQTAPLLTASLAAFPDYQSPLIPPHISLLDFYKTYSQRMLGNRQLKIISREEWGADDRYGNLDFINSACEKKFCFEEEYDANDSFSAEESSRAKNLAANYNSNFQQFDTLFLQSKKQTNGVNYYYLPVEEIIIHHTAGKFTMDLAEGKKELQRIYFMHAVQKKWLDLGYHFLIDGAGRIYEGTLAGKYSIGGHTYQHNNGAVSIALMGDFRPGHDNFTSQMQASLIKLVDYLIAEYQWNISQPLFFLKKSDFSGREWTSNIIKSHRELDLIRAVPTACPGISQTQIKTIIDSVIEI